MLNMDKILFSEFIWTVLNVQLVLIVFNTKV
jgi:hypothetical protein